MSSQSFRRIFSILLVFSVLSLIAIASERQIPSAKVKSLRGKTVDTKTFSNDGKPMVINFWATWCKPCIKELNNIHDDYPDWVEETGVKVIAISIDDARNSRRVAPFVNSRGWDYEIYLDENGDFRRAMNVQNPPHTFLVNGKGEIVWQHNGYAPGDEKALLKEIKKLTK
ncbi:TlpA disulfide reductase family protein [Candidatus Kapabacteria bacterium]|nr:TlpA disulfide reductase family protein [Candidatus Kapabacteria bacterium]